MAAGRQLLEGEAEVTFSNAYKRKEALRGNISRGLLPFA